jgi:hypothetical protein
MSSHHGLFYPNETKDGRQIMWDAVVLLVDPDPVDTILQWHADDNGATLTYLRSAKSATRTYSRGRVWLAST